jgi:hypothetical protein
MSEMWTATEDLIVVEANTEVVQTTEVVDVAIAAASVVEIEYTENSVILEASPVILPVSLSLPSAPVQQISDMISPVDAYIGYASPGSETSDESWSISRVQDTSEGIRVTWAMTPGTGAWTGLIWDDRLTYTYG